MDKLARYLGGCSWPKLFVGETIEGFMLKVISNLRTKDNDQLTSWCENIRTAKEIRDDICDIKIN